MGAVRLGGRLEEARPDFWDLAFYRFNIGEFETTAVSDGPLKLGKPQDNTFVGVTKEEFSKIQSDNFLPSENLELEQIALVINTGSQLVLIDTGDGGSKMFGDRTGRLLLNLRAAGIDPKDIDVVALTHAHADHCWGLMSGSGVRNFPNAQIYLAQADFEFWTDESKAAHPLFGAMIQPTRRQLLPNRDRMVFIKDGQELVPGIHAMSAPGHTIGHTIFMISSQQETFCNIGDLAHHHVLAVERPRLELAFDTDGKQAVQSRIRVFDMLAAQRIRMLAYHFPWPGIGHLAKQGEGYRYFPSLMQTAL